MRSIGVALLLFSLTPLAAFGQPSSPRSTPAVIEVPNVDLGPGTYLDRARRLLELHPALVRASVTSLRPRAPERSADRTQRFVQVIDGQPVVGASVSVRFDRRGRARTVNDVTRRVSTVSPAVLSADAISARALKHVAGPAGSSVKGPSHAPARPVYVVVGEEARAAFEIHVATGRALEVVKVLVDAVDGEVVSVSPAVLQ